MLQPNVDCHKFRCGFNNAIGHTERIVEIPLLFQSLPDPPADIFDFGSAGSFITPALCSLEYKVVSLDVMEYEFHHPNHSFIRTDIFDYAPQLRAKYLNHFDVTTAISTIEHVGLGFYGDKIIKEGDRLAMQILYSITKLGGKIILSFPFGQHQENHFYRVYDSNDLDKLLTNLPMAHRKERFFVRMEDGWIEAKKEFAYQVVSIGPVIGAVAFISFIKA